MMLQDAVDYHTFPACYLTKVFIFSQLFLNLFGLALGMFCVLLRMLIKLLWMKLQKVNT